MTIACEEATELLAGLAIERLDRAGRAEVAAHLETCRLHDADLAELRSVAGALVLTAEPVAPPARLRRNLLAAFDAEAVAAPSRPRTQAPSAAKAGIFARLWGSPRLGYGLAAALAIAVIGLFAWNLSLQSAGGDAVVHTLRQGNVELRVVYLKEEKLAVIDVTMPPLSADKTYQAWKITRRGAPESIGLLQDHGAQAFRTDLSGATAIAISVEPAGGSPQPTTTPVVVREL